MKRFLFASLALVGVMAATPVAHATLLGPTGPGPTSSTTISMTASLAGLTLVDQFGVVPLLLNPPGLVPPTIFGTYQEWVYRNDTTGNLVFLEQVSVIALSAPVTRITASNYTGFTTDVSYLDPSLPVFPGGQPPTALSGGIVPNNPPSGVVIDRFTPATVGFNFLGTHITAGTHSAVLMIATNATTYNRLGVLSVIDGTTSSNLTFQPTAVPEPSTMALAGLGAMGLIGYGLRRRKALGA